MSSFVVLHVTFGPEALPTSLGTQERPLVGVDHHVDAQVLLLGEGLATAGFGALKGLCAIVQVQVRLEPNASGEDFCAPLVRALEHHAFSVRVVVGAEQVLGLRRDDRVTRGDLGPLAKLGLLSSAQQSNRLLSAALLKKQLVLVYRACLVLALCLGRLKPDPLLIGMRVVCDLEMHLMLSFDFKI